MHFSEIVTENIPQERFDFIFIVYADKKKSFFLFFL
jgi:hypothetical protein